MFPKPSIFLLVAVFCCGPSCVKRPIQLTTPCSSAPSRVAAAWQALDQAAINGVCDGADAWRCEALRTDIERLSAECPSIPQVVMANALLAFERHDLARSQQLLDQYFGLQASSTEAVVLRARIAMEQGNLPFALRFLEQQISRTGDVAPLRETYASALYLAGRYDQARDQLAIAGRLGAPMWRVDFGLGLIDEGAHRYDAAAAHYRQALAARPQWRPAESRLRTLEATGLIAAQK